MRVAVHYGLSAGSLLFLLKVDNFMQYGAELGWLSAFPTEAEVRVRSRPLISGSVQRDDPIPGPD